MVRVAKADCGCNVLHREIGGPEQVAGPADTESQMVAGGCLAGFAAKGAEKMGAASIKPLDHVVDDRHEPGEFPEEESGPPHDLLEAGRCPQWSGHGCNTGQDFECFCCGERASPHGDSPDRGMV